MRSHRHDAYTGNFHASHARSSESWGSRIDQRQGQRKAAMAASSSFTCSACSHCLQRQFLVRHCLHQACSSTHCLRMQPPSDLVRGCTAARSYWKWRLLIDWYSRTAVTTAPHASACCHQYLHITARLSSGLLSPIPIPSTTQRTTCLHRHANQSLHSRPAKAHAVHTAGCTLPPLTHRKHHLYEQPIIYWSHLSYSQHLHLHLPLPRPQQLHRVPKLVSFHTAGLLLSRVYTHTPLWLRYCAKKLPL